MNWMVMKEGLHKLARAAAMGGELHGDKRRDLQSVSFCSHLIVLTEKWKREPS